VGSKQAESVRIGGTRPDHDGWRAGPWRERLAEPDGNFGAFVVDHPGHLTASRDAAPLYVSLGFRPEPAPLLELLR
jgi:hypothetical protein